MVSVLDLTQKDVITMRSGTRLGRVDDVTFCKETAVIDGMTIFGRLKLFGLLGREPDLYIKYSDIVNIGTDVILVKSEPQNAGSAHPSLQK